MRSTLALLACVAALTAQAAEQDINISCGRLRGTREAHGSAGTCGLDFSYGLGDHVSINAVYLNEGHLDNHHRDGFALQPGVNWNAGRWRLHLAAGPYYSMDTTRTAEGLVHNEKVLGLLASAAVKLYVHRELYVGLGYNSTWMRNKVNTNGVVLLAGTEVGQPSAEQLTEGRERIGFWLGTGTTTNPDSSIRRAAQLEWSRPINDDFSGSVALLHEGNTGLAKRNGVLAQAWYNEARARWTFSVGAGPYLSHDSLLDDDRNRLLAAASLRVRYRYNSRTDIGLNMNRIVSFYHRDADIFVLGMQRAF